MSAWEASDGQGPAQTGIATEKATAVYVLGALVFLIFIRKDFAKILPRLGG